METLNTRTSSLRYWYFWSCLSFRSEYGMNFGRPYIRALLSRHSILSYQNNELLEIWTTFCDDSCPPVGLASIVTVPVNGHESESPFSPFIIDMHKSRYEYHFHLQNHQHTHRCTFCTPGMWMEWFTKECIVILSNVGLLKDVWRCCHSWPFLIKMNIHFSRDWCLYCPDHCVGYWHI